MINELGGEAWSLNSVFYIPR